MSWNIILYESGAQKPVEKIINSLQVSTQVKLRNGIRLLEEFGPDLGMPRSKPLGDGLYELRIRGKQEIRIFYIYAHKRNIYLLHAFIKKTQATPSKELKIARSRQIDFKNNNN